MPVQAYWILPNRDQRDELLASNGEKIVPLRKILDPTLRPEGFSHGVPAELLERCDPKQLADILFAQRFPDWNGNKQLFMVSTPAGVDSSGRIVHLGMLFILGPHERPSFDLPYAGLPKQEQSYAHSLVRRMASAPRGDCWVRSVRELSELPVRRGPASNVELQRSVVPFYSLYAIAPGGLTRKVASWGKVRPRSMLLILLVAVGAWLSERACQHVPSPSGCIGAIACRSS